ncbi:MFS transporter, partial [Vibrio mimicus]
NIPLCLIILIFGYFFIPETKSEDTQQYMDTRGIILFILLLLFIMVPVSLGKHWPELWWLLVGAIPCTKLLWSVEKNSEFRGQKPILPPSLFKTPMVITGFISEMTVTFAYPGYLFVTALCLQSELHFSSIESGNTFITLGATFFIGSLLSKRLSQRIRGHHIYILGAILTVIGFLGTILLIGHYHSDINFYQLWGATGVIGFGNSMMLTSAYRITLSQVGKHHASEASSALATVQQGCFALGTAFAGAVYSYSISYGYLHAISLSVGTLSILLLIVGIPTNIKSANQPQICT